MNYRLRAALASTPMLLLLSATLCALADDTVNVTLEDASVWFAMTELSAQAYARAHAVWRQWLKHWHLTGDPRALRTALVWRQIADEKMHAVGRSGLLPTVASIEIYPRRGMAMSPAELRHLSRVLLARAGRVRADADASRRRSIKCRLKADVARASAEDRHAVSRRQPGNANSPAA